MLLMVLRAAVLLLIAAGLARPTVTSLGSLWGGASSAVVIILDNSASMGMIDAGPPPLRDGRRGRRANPRSTWRRRPGGAAA